MTGTSALAADMLQPGAKAPEFSLPSQEDTNVSLSQYKGKWVVLYFYPKDMTTGCTIEAHNFQRDLPKYEALNAVVLGVSLDTVESHKTFCTKDSLTFKLLADPDHKLTERYGLWVEKTMAGKRYMGVERSTVVIDENGTVAKVFRRVKPAEHAQQVLTALG